MSCSVHGCSASSGTTPTATQTLKHARTMREPRHSPEPQAEAISSPHDTSGTEGSTTHSIKQHSARSVKAQDAETSTTNEGPKATSTTKPYEHSQTEWSESSTAASPPAPSTTNTPPGTTDNNQTSRSPLDTYTPGVSSWHQNQGAFHRASHWERGINQYE